MCDVPSTAVFCSESIECFPGTVSKFFFKLLVTIPVAPNITGIIVHFRFHIRCISIHKLLYFNFFIIIIIIIITTTTTTTTTTTERLADGHGMYQTLVTDTRQELSIIVLHSFIEGKNG